MKKILPVLLLLSATAYAEVTCDQEKTVNGKPICVINVPLDIPKSLVNGGAIDVYAKAHGWDAKVVDPNCTPKPAVTCDCTPSPAVTCPPEEESMTCFSSPEITCPPCTQKPEVVCQIIDNPMSTLEYAKRIIRRKIKSEYIEIYKKQVSKQANEQVENELKTLFPE